jgi:hypothetical protein
MTTVSQPSAREPTAPQRGQFYVTVYPVLWALFRPVRAHQEKHRPEEYAANGANYKKK